MKRDFHFSFYSRIFVLAIIGFGFFALLQKVPSDAEVTGIAQPLEFSGWAWSPNMGWLSLNCLNDFDGDGELENSCLSIHPGYDDYGPQLADYSLNLEVTGANESERSVQGCAWAGNIGWYVCFSDPCYDGSPGSECTEAPTGGIYLNDYYNAGVNPNFTGLPAANEVINSLCHTGDAECHPSILFFEDPGDVWTHEFGFPIGNTIVGPGQVNGCFNCQSSETKQCFGGDNDGSDCTADPNICNPGDPPGTCEVIDVDYNCDNCLQYNYGLCQGGSNDGGYCTAVGDCPGGSCATELLHSVIGGYQCTNCNNFDDTISCQANAYQSNANTCTCQYRYNTPGLMVDYTQDANGMGSICGWGWHAYYDDPLYYGVGWLQFSPRITTSTQPYFAVEGGNIYSKGNIRSYYPPPFNKYNAYLIETSGDTIYNLFSYNTTTPSLLTNRPIINFPADSGTGQFKNILGKIDFDGLITEIGVTDKNKYGMDIVNSIGDFDNGGGAISLNNQVYYYDGSWVSTPPGTVTINSAGGPGVIVIDGSVILNENIVYDSTSASSIKDIASLVWIIKGTLTIAPNVTELAGTFIILGNGSDCSTEPMPYLCGQFDLLGGGSNPLTVYGGVMAKNFNLTRPRGTGGEPSEKFVNDGRLRINPPTGLTDFAKNMPIFNYNN